MENRKGPPSYYGILGVSLLCSSDDEVRRAYRKLAMKCHPDKWTGTPALLGEAKHNYQQIQEVYAGMYDPDDDDVEVFADFLQEMDTLIKEEEKSYSVEELQSMFGDMAQGFDIPEWSRLYMTECDL